MTREEIKEKEREKVKKAHEITAKLLNHLIYKQVRSYYQQMFEAVKSIL